MAKQLSYSKLKLEKFKKNIESKLQKISDDMNDLKENMETRPGNNSIRSQESVYSVHMAEAGTDSYEREKGFQLMNRESDYYKFLNKALERISDGSFGVCKVCNSLIPEERMTEVPNATKCVGCKENEKLNLG
jgi:RNA polymerase-binding transcription factor DksA